MATEKMEKLPGRGRAGVWESFTHDLHLALNCFYANERTDTINTRATTHYPRVSQENCDQFEDGLKKIVRGSGEG